MNINNMIGLKKRKSSHDLDGDGVMNQLDCEPRNPNKQGFIHTLAKKYGNKGVRQWGEKGEQRSSERKVERTELKSIQRKNIQQERVAKEGAIHTEKMRYYREREKQKTDKRLAFAKSGGYSGAIFRGTVGLADKMTAPPKRASPVRRASPKKRTNRKTSKKRATIRRTKPRAVRRTITKKNDYDMPSLI